MIISFYINLFENVVCKMAAILREPQRVNLSVLYAVCFPIREWPPFWY